MKRTFKHKISVQSVATVVVLAACALVLFLSQMGTASLAGLALLMLGAVAVDRMVHSEYVFTDDGCLTICRGRIAKPIAIKVDEIVAMRRIRGALLIAPHVILEYGVGHITSVQPSDAEGFIREVKRRQNNDNI